MTSSLRLSHFVHEFQWQLGHIRKTTNAPQLTFFVAPLLFSRHSSIIDVSTLVVVSMVLKRTEDFWLSTRHMEDVVFLAYRIKIMYNS